MFNVNISKFNILTFSAQIIVLLQICNVNVSFAIDLPCINEHLAVQIPASSCAGIGC
jgi:hypothetical protein